MNLNNILSIVLVLTIIISESCTQYSSQQNTNAEIKPIAKIDSFAIGLHDTTIKIRDRKRLVEINIKVPLTVKPTKTLLVLQGWNLPASDWCTKTDLCDQALKKGYVIVVPHIDRGNYLWENFQETLPELRVFPTRRWIIDTLFSYLNKNYHLFANDKRSYIVGLSTGGHGCALLALECPEIFNGMASLSGDFDPSQYTSDPFYEAYYGSSTQFPERWKGRDNVAVRIKDYKVHSYLGHGKNDKVVQWNQTKLFYNLIKKYHPELKVAINLPDSAGHNYNYWKSEVKNILQFFDDIISEK